MLPIYTLRYRYRTGTYSPLRHSVIGTLQFSNEAAYETEVVIICQLKEAEVRGMYHGTSYPSLAGTKANFIAFVLFLLQMIAYVDLMATFWFNDTKAKLSF